MSAAPHRAGTRRRHDVTIRGAGIVGQALALLLARDRLRVALVDPSAHQPAAPGSTDVRAYALNSASRDLLQSLRCWPQAASDDTGPPAVTAVRAMQVHGDDGGRLRFDANGDSTAALTWIVDVPALERRLAEAVDFQSGIDRLEEAPDSGLTIICEGKRSQTREALGIEFDVRPYPHKALAARLRCARPHGGQARQWFRDGQIMALLPLEGDAGHAVALVWSLPTAQAEAAQALAPQAFAEAVQAFCGHALGDMTPEGPVQAWPLELSRARRWIARTASGTVALAGDAAHAMHPLAGQGLNVGLADVAELARVLHAREYWREPGDWRLLRRYERARQADVHAMGWLTDGLFNLFGHDDARVQALRNWGMRGVDRLGPLKHWLARQASGVRA
ncbi:MAG: ubiquinone biosynthesis protein UbiH [Burkholderiales bacterium]|nr:MAG: ubiquinone biosynthesis protein UbiH [Burkholderiales bacterium]